jgi:type II secretory pathway pseudopilin PulG
VSERQSEADHSAFRTPHSALRTPHSAFRTPHSALRTSAAFSLIEILVVVALMTIIILGLLLMFLQTQRAFTSSMTQADVLAAGRATMDLLTRELEQMTPSQMPTVRASATANSRVYYCTNFLARLSAPFFPPMVQGMPGTTISTGAQATRTNIVQDVFFLTRNNQDWIGTGYAVIPYPGSSGIGALYRFVSTTNTMLNSTAPSLLSSNFLRALPVATNIVYNGSPITNALFMNSVSKIADGVVHFRVGAYATNGYPLFWDGTFGSGMYHSNTVFGPPNIKSTGPTGYNPLPNSSAVAYNGLPGAVDCYLWSNAVPAAVELEVGFLEQHNVDRLKAIASAGNTAAMTAYLSNHVAQVHIFRQRILVPNVDSTAYVSPYQ